MPKRARGDRLAPADFAAPLFALLPPRHPSGHPVNAIRGKILRLLERVADLRAEARALVAAEPTDPRRKKLDF